MRSYEEKLHSARGTALQVSLLKLLPFDQNSLIFNRFYLCQKRIIKVVKVLTFSKARLQNTRPTKF